MENKPKKMNIRGWLFIFLFVFTILVAGVTVSYAYYTLNIRGQASTEENTSTIFLAKVDNNINILYLFILDIVSPLFIMYFFYFMIQYIMR